MVLADRLNRIASQIRVAQLDFSRYIREVKQIQRKVQTDSRDSDLWLNKLGIYVEGGIREGYLPKGFARTYNRIIKGLGTSALQGDLSGYDAVFAAILKSAERQSKRAPKGGRAMGLKDVAQRVFEMMQSLSGARVGRPWIKATIAMIEASKGESGLEVTINPYRKEFRVQIAESSQGIELEDIITDYESLDVMVGESLRRLWSIHT
tara:strand:- start:39456 stop:40076 length:621 start_codon:yes stop_codon:yes gene_type:complete